MHYSESVIHLQFSCVRSLSKTVCLGHYICYFFINRGSINCELERYWAEMAAALKKDVSGDVLLAVHSNAAREVARPSTNPERSLPSSTVFFINFPKIAHFVVTVYGAI